MMMMIALWGEVILYVNLLPFSFFNFKLLGIAGNGWILMCYHIKYTH